jgi:hypothetical protein
VDGRELRIARPSFAPERLYRLQAVGKAVVLVRFPVALPCLAVLVAFLTAGCAASSQTPQGDEPDTTMAWEPLPCDPSGATTRGRNAELVHGLQQSPEGIAQDIARTVGDPLGRETTREPEHRTWATESGGEVSISLWTTNGTAGGFGQAQYEGPRSVDRPAMERLFERWGVEKETLVYGSPMFGGDGSNGPASQRVLGHDVGWTEGGATWHGEGATWLSILRFWEFASVDATVGAERATQTGGEAARCVLDEEGKTEAAGHPMIESHMLWMGVFDGSIAYVVDVRFESPDEEDLHCGLGKWVYVDAVTGAVLSIGEPFCV